MIYQSSLFLVFFWCGIISCLMARFHYFMVLLSIEVSMLSLFCLLSVESSWGNTLDLMVMFIIMMVIEGAFGLCILVKYANSTGGDYFWNSTSF